MSRGRGQCCAVSEDGLEPILTDAALSVNDYKGAFTPTAFKLQADRSGWPYAVPPCSGFRMYDTEICIEEPYCDFLGVDELP